MRLAKLKPGIVFVVMLAVFSSCQKSIEKDTANTGTPNPPGPVFDKIKDSSLLYARDLFLWNDQIPSAFDAQSYADPNKIMEAIRVYSKEPGFAEPVDRWSFAIDQKSWDDASTGIVQDFGMNVFFNAASDLRVKHVEKASPAGQAGIRRGWKITRINGNTNVNTNNIDFIVNAIFESPASSFTFQKPDGTTTDISLNAATYQEHPIVLDTVYTVSSKKVGYFVFNSFLGDTTEIINEFGRIFNNFSAQNVDDVIIDLRYNGGGYVSLQSKLANYLVPSTGNNDVMMTQQYNSLYSQFNSTTRFKKSGNLNLSRIFFIVSNSTASASELLINNLTPYLDVKIIGPSESYGKPVGYFAIPVGDWYIFPVSSRSINKSGQGNYFNGFPVQGRVADGLTKDWGDVTESCLASALKYIGTGSFRLMQQEHRIATEVKNGNSKIDSRSFKGAINTPRF